jgi:serine protease Do
LKEYGKVIRGYLGIYGQDVTPDIAELLNLKNSQGIIVASVEKDSPADQAGLESHDIILEMNGKKIESYDSFRNDIAEMKPNSKINLTVLRNGETRNVTVTLGVRPTEVAQSNQPVTQPKSQEALGVKVQNVTKDIANQFDYPVGEGVIVSGVVQGSPADNAGIQTGDLIESVDRQSVNSVDEFERALNRNKQNKILLLIRRGEFSQFVVVQLTL